MGSGPLVARLFHRLLAAIFLVAWLSLGAQVLVLVGSRGLLPAEGFVRALGARPDLSFVDVPTLFRGGASDAALAFGVEAGIALSALALAGVLPRALLPANAVLYLSYAVVCRSFLAFQWDNLLIECGVLAGFVPENRPSRWSHLLLRIALFKLYFESGIAKYQSYLHDWQDGSAMAYYYETAPIPTRLAWYAHRFPAAWHKVESWGTLGFEIGVPFLIFGPRPARLAAFVVFTGFQVANIATANYGFFSYLAVVLGVFLLDDADVLRVSSLRSRLGARAANAFPRAASVLGTVHARLSALRERMRKAVPAPSFPASSDAAQTLVFLLRLSAAAVVTAIYAGVSFEAGMETFAGGPALRSLSELATAIAPFRAVNTYHLFGHITRERIEPTFETFDGATWTEHDLHYKPGDPARPPPFVAPHQPRVDFLLWFYGLSYESGTPEYVRALLDRLCHDPAAVQALFTSELPERPAAVRVAFFRHHFTTADERGSRGAWWVRTEVGTPRVMRCE
jgi:uncharacterized membrane protein YphA (DoxX/SURF4 family)